MTLKNRNRIFLITIVIFSLILLLNIFLFTFAAFKGNIKFFEKELQKNFFTFFFSNLSAAGIIASIVLCAYATISAFLVTQAFEKTHAPEIIYFSEFLLGIFLNSFKLYILLFSLDSIFSSLSLFIQKAALAGQILCILSFLLASIFSDDDQIQNTDKNFLIILAAAIIISGATPVNLHTIRLSGLADIGFKNTFITVIILLMLITALSFAICWYKRDEKRFLKSSFAFILIICGSFCVIYSTHYFLLTAGSFVLALGTKMYISMLHKYYLWK